jgi:hypothetical protein
MTQDQVAFIGATQITINALGASVFPYKFQSGAGSIGGQLKLLSGTTVCIVPNAVSGASIGGATAITTIGGYYLQTSEMYPWYGPASFYIATTSATAVISSLINYTAGGASLA